MNYPTPEGQDYCSAGNTFTYTGAIQTWVVPAGVTKLKLKQTELREVVATEANLSEEMVP